MQTEAGGDSRFAGFNGEAGEGVVSEQEDEAQEADPQQGEPGQRGEIRVSAGGRVRAGGGGGGSGQKHSGEGEVFPPEYLDFTAQWREPKPFEQR